jgi:hypothetical protein
MIEKFEKQYKDDAPFEKTHEIEKRFSIERSNHITDIINEPPEVKSKFTTTLLEKPIEKDESKATKSKPKRVHSGANKATIQDTQKKIRKG